MAVLVPMAALAGTATTAVDLGTIDATFDAGDGGLDDKVFDMAFTSDGHIVIAGSVRNYNGESAARVARLHADGNLDDAFNAAIGSGPDGYIESIDIDASGRIHAAGNFGNFDGEPREGLVRLGPDGSLDSAFTIAFLESSNFPGAKQRPRLVEENEGAVWVAGNWDGYDNGGGLDWTDTVVRFDGTGSSASDVIAGTIPLAFGFQPTTPVGMKVAPDGDLVVYGRFSSPRNGIYEVDPDGTPDGTFSFAPDVAENTGPNNTVTGVAFVDDTVLAVGNFTSFHGDTSPAGMPDTTIAIDGDGNLYLVGVVSDAFGGVGNFGRLLRDGQVDDTFPVSIAASFPRVAAGPDGSVYRYRDLAALGGEASARLLRMVTDSGATVPGAPGSIRAVPHGANVIVSWSLPTDGATPEQ